MATLRPFSKGIPKRVKPSMNISPMRQKLKFVSGTHTPDSDLLQLDKERSNIEFKSEMEKLKKKRIKELGEIYNDDCDNNDVDFIIDAKILLQNMMRQSVLSDEISRDETENNEVEMLQKELSLERERNAKLASDLEAANEVISTLNATLKEKDEKIENLKRKVKLMEDKGSGFDEPKTLKCTYPSRLPVPSKRICSVRE